MFLEANMTSCISIRRALLAAGAVLLVAQDAMAAERTIGSLRFIGEQDLALGTTFQDTPVGGLSGADYDQASATWYLLSDDRSAKAPARFYTARLAYDADKVAPPELLSVVTLTQADGKLFPNAEQGGEVPDPESLRLDPKGGSLWWTSEGDRKLGIPPSVRQAGLDGHSKAPLPTPAMFAVHKDTESGTRNNNAFEGLSFAPDGESFWVSQEEPIYEDGPIPTPDAGAVTRITRFDRQGKILGQVAYPLDAIPAKPGEGKNADNGISEILVVDDTHLLVLERSGVQAADDSYRDYIRLYAIDVAGASDVSAIPALAGATFTPVKKRLVLNFDDLKLRWIDNVECMGFGAKLANGHDSLVFVSDDNFNKSEITQFLVFEVLP
jgi:hypothetical protein